MGLTRLVLKIALGTPHPERFERFLFVGPHPDDIEIGAGATAAKLAAMGKQICFLICTDGRYGTENMKEPVTYDELIEIRKKEAAASAAYLGIDDIRFLGLSDGGAYTQQELRKGIAQTISSFKPDVVLCPDPNVSSECHIDHLNVGEAVRRACCFSSNPGTMEQYGCDPHAVQALAYYMTAKPNRFIRTAGYLKKQIYAIQNMFPSQMPEGSSDYSVIPLYLNVRSVDFGIRSLKGCAEGFRVLGKGAMHCVPEFGTR